MSNAVKFTEQGEVELKIEVIDFQEYNYSLKFSVRDTGVGIDIKNQQKIFEAFSQADNSITRKFGGTGLGLTISNKLLALMDSELKIKSEINKGSIFYFEINIQTAENQEFDWKNVNNINNILIVDDNQNNRKILSEMLKLKNISSTEAENGFQALQILQNQVFDAVLMDHHMHNIDGLTVVSKIRNDLKINASQLPIILLHSSSENEHILKECAILEIHKRLIKPVTIKNLYDSLSKIKSQESLQLFKPKFKAQESEQTQEYTKFKILIADDHPVNMLLTQTIISSILPGAKILEATNGLQAVEIYKKEKPEIIFMDIQMPIMNGYEATIEIRNIDNKHKVSIIALTAGTVKGEKEKCFEVGMNDFITKPVVKETIEKMIHKWLRPNSIDSIKDFHQSLFQPDIKINKVELVQENELIEHFDYQSVMDLIGNNEEMYKIIISTTKATLMESLNELKSEFEVNNLKNIQLIAHKIKGGALSVKMEILTNLSNELEFVEVNNIELIKKLIKNIEIEINYILTII